MRTRILASLAAIAALTVLTVGDLPAQDAGEKGEPSAKQVEAKKLELARRVMDLSQGGDYGKRIMDRMMDAFSKNPMLPDGFVEAFKAKVNVKDLVDRVCPIYAKHLEIEEMEAAIDWLESPMGKRWVAKQGPILEEAMKIGEQWGREVTMQVLSEMQK